MWRKGRVGADIARFGLHEHNASMWCADTLDYIVILSAPWWLQINCVCVCVSAGLHRYLILNMDITTIIHSVWNSAIYVIGSLYWNGDRCQTSGNSRSEFFVTRQKSGFTVYHKWSGNLHPRAFVTQVPNAQITSCRVAPLSERGGRLWGVWWLRRMLLGDPQVFSWRTELLWFLNKK